MDGHERNDVVEHRVEYLQKMKELRDTHKPPPPCSDERAATPPPDAETRKVLVLIYHDEAGIPPEQKSNRVLNGIHEYLI